MHHSASVAATGLPKHEPAVTYKKLTPNTTKGSCQIWVCGILGKGGGVSHFQLTNMADSELHMILNFCCWDLKLLDKQVKLHGQKLVGSLSICCWDVK